ncbi:Polygalacturonase QRT3 [Linum grandiflorum]
MTWMMSFLIVITSLILHLQQASCSKDHGRKQQLGRLIEDIVAEIEQIAAVAREPPSTVRPPPKVGGVFYPIGYGADPTGHKDSTDVIQQVLNDAFLQLSDQKRKLLPGIKDVGGPVIDLQEGSLRASKHFPDDRFLIELISPKSEVLINKTDSIQKFQGVGIYYEDITFRDILFDSGFHGGGLLVVDAVRTRVINSYFMNFTSQGMSIQGGHETFISSCFIGQKPSVGSDKSEKYFSGVGIDMASNDNVITDTVIFSSEIGLLLRGQANVVTGLHVYNKGTELGGSGIYVKEGAAFTRLDNCYMDYNSVIIEDPYFTHVTNSLFLGDGNVVVRSVYGRITSLTITDNYFHGIKLPIVGLDGEFGNVDQVVVENNQAKFMPVKSTVGKMTVAGKGKRWVADFNEQLLFPNKINHFHYSVFVKPKQGGGGDAPFKFPVHAATNVSGNVVVVESEEVVDAVVSVVVDQFNQIGELTVAQWLAVD